MKSGEIILVKFPFTNLDTTKKRPALVIQNIPFNKKESLVLIAMITSKIEGLNLDYDVLLLDWKTSGLLHPSLIRLSKMVTLESNLIEKKLGTLSQSDSTKVKKELKKLFAHWA